MKGIKHLGMIILFSTSFTFSACSTTSSTTSIPQPPETSSEELKEEAESPDYSSRLPQQIKTHEKTVLIDPNVLLPIPFKFILKMAQKLKLLPLNIPSDIKDDAKKVFH